ncbi:MAG: hypothetical protein JW862_03680 [Anaerolineales bacterium]|nr:hypothetical protein [Anaerolineales bacterium]
MAKKSLEVQTTPHIVIKQCHDLQIKGWDRDEVLVKSSSDNDVSLEEREDGIHISCPNDCLVYLPSAASVQVGQVAVSGRFRSVEGKINIGQIGASLSLHDIQNVEVERIGADLSAKRIRNHLSIKTIGGNAVVQDSTSTTIETVGGQLVAKRVRGDLQVETVGGNAVVRDIDGQVHLKGVNGSLHLRDVSGGITAEVLGQASLDFSPVSWQAYSIKAAGDVRCRIPGDSDVTFEIMSAARSIQIKTPKESQEINEQEYHLDLGEGGALVKLTGGGSVSITGMSAGWELGDEIEIDFGAEFDTMAEELAAQATQQIEAQMELIQDQLNIHLSGLSMSLKSAGLSEERAQEVQERLERARQRAAERAQAAAERTQAKLERQLEATHRRAERKARAQAVRTARKQRERELHIRTEYTSPSPMVPPVPRPPTEPVSEDERMLILQMLQEKKISVEQAEQLLSALEGK